MKNLFLIVIFLSSISTFSQTILKEKGKYGLAGKNGDIIIKPSKDSIYFYRKEFRRINDYGYYIVKKSNKYGVAILTKYKGWFVSKIDYDTVIHENLCLIVLKKTTSIVI